MTLPLQNISSEARTEASDVSIIRREFVALTGDHFSAVILNQLLYWTQRVKDFDLLLEEERQFKPDCNISPRHGWIYKTADELNEETMLGISHPTMRKYLKLLTHQGWIDERANPVERWNKTTQYRVNLRKIEEDLSVLGRTLPHVYLKAFASSLQECVSAKGLQKSFENVEKIPNVKNLHSDENSDSFFEDSPKSEENSNVRNFYSDVNSEDSFLEDCPKAEENANERNLHSDVKIFGSDESSLHSNVKNFDSNVKNLHSYTYTENTHKNTNKEHTQRTRACKKNFSDFENSKNSISENSISENSVAEEMVSLWEQHVGQKVLRLTEERKGQLESLFTFHFQNDIRLWERFCLRVKASPFLMGEGARRWRVSLDWVLVDGNFLKVLEGNFDDSNRFDSSESIKWNSGSGETDSSKNAEKEAIIASIEDPVWKNWCSRLATGIRYNELRMLHEPLSLLELEQIANAWFLEVEDDRLVWVGSSDQRVLNKIEDLRLKISWILKKEYPKASTFRTRLEPNPNHQLSITGKTHHE